MPLVWLPPSLPGSAPRTRPDRPVAALSTALIPAFDACALGPRWPRDVESRGAVESARPTADHPQPHAAPGEVTPLDGTQPICRVLEVSASGYYAWRVRRDSVRVATDDELCAEIRVIFEETRGAYGVPRMTDELRDRGHLINRKRVARLMREMGLRGRHARRFRPITTVTDPEGPIAEDLLRQDFSAEGPNQRWVGDITDLTTSDGFEYLATVMDLYSRRIVGWALSPSLDASIAIDAMEMALR